MADKKNPIKEKFNEKFNKDKIKSDVKTYVDTRLDQDIDSTISKLWRGRATKDRGSIIGVAKQNMFEFPVFISNNVPFNFAMATTALLDQVYMSYVQMALSTTPMINLSDARRGIPFSNLKVDTTKYLECTDMSYAHDACHSIFQEGNIIYEFNLISIEDKDATVINEYMDYVPLSEFSHYFQEANADNNDEMARIKLATARANLDRLERQKELSELQCKKLQQDLDKAELDLENKRTKNAMDKLELVEKETNQKRSKDDSFANLENRLRSAKEANIASNAIGVKLSDRDVQRLNSMKPMVQEVTIQTLVGDTNQHAENMNYIVGVKTHSRLIDASILPEVAEYPLKEMNKISRKAKWRAGELKFVKDILFNIKGKKQAAIDARDPRRKWYKRLYTLAHSKGDAISASYFSGRSQNEGVIPNVSMIISKGDIDNIRDKTNIDLLDGHTAVSFCKELFLMALLVVDIDTETIRMLLPDLHNDYEVHSFASVNKQISLLDTTGSKTKEIFKVLK